jgi:hypothetical protein
MQKRVWFHPYDAQKGAPFYSSGERMRLSQSVLCEVRP